MVLTPQGSSLILQADLQLQTFADWTRLFLSQSPLVDTFAPRGADQTRGRLHSTESAMHDAALTRKRSHAGRGRLGDSVCCHLITAYLRTAYSCSQGLHPPCRTTSVRSCRCWPAQAGHAIT